MGISYIEMNEQKIPIEDEELRGVVPTMQGEIDLLKGTVGYTSPNRLPYPYADTTKTVVGVTYTDVGDGTVTLSGTSTAVNSFTLNHQNILLMTLKKGKYILSGCPQGGGDNTYCITLNGNINGVSTVIAKDYGDGVEFELTEDINITHISMSMASGVNVDGLIFEPMIVSASLGKIPFEPYVEDVQTNINEHKSQLDTINSRLYWNNGAVVLKSVNALELQDGKGRGVWLTYNDSWGSDVSYIIPTVNKSVNLGKSDYHFKSVYCESVTQSSDRRMKNSINYSVADMVELVNNLKPCSFKYNDSDDMQYGLIAQDVRDYLVENNKDFSGLVIDKAEDCKEQVVNKNSDENNVIYGLDYIKIIPCLIAKVQELEERLAKLEQ